MSFDPETYELFQASNFDAYDSGSDRYPAVLRACLEQHGLELSDVIAVTQDLGLWAICRAGLLRGNLRGIFKKRIEVGEMLPYSRIGAIVLEPSGPHTLRVALEDDAGNTIHLDYTGRMDGLKESNTDYAKRVYRTLEGAMTNALSGSDRVG